MLYNPLKLMRRLSLVVALLVVCGWTAVTVSSHVQQAGSSAASEPRSFPASAWRAIAHGKTADAEAMARARPQGDADAAAILGFLAVRRGQFDEGLKLLEPAAAREPLGEAALQLGLLQQVLGRSANATETLTPIFREGADGSDQMSVLRAGRAAHALGRAREANSLYRSASAGGSNPTVDTAWGMLFLEKYNTPEAVKSFQQALEADPEWAPAHAGLARALAEDNPPAAGTAAGRALAIDPNLAEAELLLAQLDLDNTQYAAARQRIDRVLAYNPSQLDARALAAAIVYVREGRAAFDAEAKKVLAINPAYGELYRAAAELTARNYRFEEAVALAKEAVALDPTNARAHAELGMHLMRTGDEAEARRSLDRAFRADPYDKITYNLLQLLDTLDTFVVVKEGDIVLKLHPDDAAVMQGYAMPLAQQALRDLSKRYRFTPKGPILVEMFPEHDDFAVRTLGLPGMLGALGACFGKVVTLDSPRARPPGTFQWQATLWHEMAHVITLQMSQQRVPRWLTEGISVYEESKARPEWGRDMEVPFAVAAGARQGAQAARPERGVHQPGDDRARLLRGVAPRRSHRPGLRRAEAPGAGHLVRAGARGGRRDREDDRRVARPAAGGVRQGARRALRRAARRAAPGPAQGRLGRSRGAALGARPRRRAASPRSSRSARRWPRRETAPRSNRSSAPPRSCRWRSGKTARTRSWRGWPSSSATRRGRCKEYEALLAQDHTTVEPARRLAALAEKAATPAAPPLAGLRPRGRDRSLRRRGAHRPGADRAQEQRRAGRDPRVQGSAGDRRGRPCRRALRPGRGLPAGQPAGRRQERGAGALEIAPSFERAQELLLRSLKTAAPGSGR